jgi:hypothetical protein
MMEATAFQSLVSIAGAKPAKIEDEGISINAARF